MKKISVMAMCAVAVFGVSAQVNVVKEAERAMKGGQETAKVVEIITPAFTDPATSGMAQTWYVPGKAAYNEYDKMLGLRQFNQLGEDGPAKMANLLIQGYDYFQKALPLDSVPNEKGQVKPKHSKDMVGLMAGHFADYSNAGADLYNAKDFKGAFRCWEIFGLLPQNPDVAKKINNMPADTIFGEIAFNQALAAWQAEDLKGALGAFMNAKSKGYKKKPLYDYAIAVAAGDNNNDAVFELAKEALGLYGKEDPMYMGQVVNHYLQNKEYDQAFTVINDAIALEPTNAQYYVIQGVLYENVEKKAEAKAAYQKAMQLDPKNAQAVYNYGRQLCEEAYAANDSAPTTQKEYDEYFRTSIEPLFKEAAEVLENAYDLDQDNRDVLKYLENVYYNLKDEKKLQDVQNRMKY